MSRFKIGDIVELNDGFKHVIKQVARVSFKPEKKTLIGIYLFNNFNNERSFNLTTNTTPLIHDWLGTYTIQDECLKHAE